MSRLVFKDGTTVGGALAVGQTLRLGGFFMTACSAAAPTMTSRVIENSLHVKSALAEQMDPMELASLNELLDRIAALGVARTMIGLGLNPIKGRLTLHRSPIILQWWRNNAEPFPLS